MPDKRGFHIVVLMDDDARLLKGKPLQASQSQSQVQQQSQQKTIETQMLFLLYAASNDIRTRCLDSLQTLTGKVTVNSPIQISDQTQSQAVNKSAQSQEYINLSTTVLSKATESADTRIKSNTSNADLYSEEEDRLKSMSDMHFYVLEWTI